MTQTNLQRFAESQGIKGKVSELSQAEQVQLRYNYVMGATKNAQGDFARTSDQAANATRVFTESAKELGSSIGQYLLPVITPYIQKGSEMLKQFSELDSGKKKFILYAGGVAAAAGPMIFGLSKVVGAVMSINKAMTSAKAYFSGYRGDLAKTGAQSMASAGQMQAAAQMMPDGGASASAVDMVDDIPVGSRVANNSGKGNILTNLFKKGGASAAANVADDAIPAAGSRVANSAASPSFLAKIFGAGGKTASKAAGVAGKVGGAATILTVGLNALDLLSMNKKNAGEKLGKFGGSTGGALGGAAIGSMIAPGIGTAIGGAIGSLAGSKLGATIGEKLQDWVKGTSAKDIGGKVGAVLGGVIGGPAGAKLGKELGEKAIPLAKKAVQEVKDFFAEPFDTEIKASDNIKDKDYVSEESAKSVNQYLELENSISAKRNYQASSGLAMTEEEKNEIIKTYDEMANVVTGRMDEIHDTSAKNFTKLTELGLIGANEYDEFTESAKNNLNEQKEQLEEYTKQAQDLTNEYYSKEAEVTQRYEDEINAIKQKAKEDGRTLTEAELEEIKRLEEEANQKRIELSNERNSRLAELDAEMKESAVANMTASEEEQLVILGRLKDSASEISAKQAAEVVKNSAKARDESIDAANKKYEESIAIAEQEYYVTGNINKEQYEAIVGRAKQTRDDSIATAEEMHEGVVSQAKLQADGHLAQVDWETGEVLSKWDIFKAGLAEKVNWVTSGINKVLEFFSLPTIRPWTPAGYQNDTSSSSGARATGAQMAYKGAKSISGQVLVGEEGYEVAYHKASSTARILGADGPEIASVEPGTRILNHSDSKKMLSGGLGAGTVLPGFSNGNTSLLGMASDLFSGTVDTGKNIYNAVTEKASSIIDSGKETVSNVVNTVSEKASDITSKVSGFAEEAWEWVSDPTGKVNELIARYNDYKENDGVNSIGFGALNKIGDGAKEWLSEKLGGVLSFEGSAGPSGKSAQAWSGVIQQAAKAMQVNLSASELGGIIAQIHRESGGSEKITQSSAVVDINTMSGNPARGLLQYIPQSFSRFSVKGHNNIYSGYDQLLAFFNNSNWRRDLPYGTRGWGPSGLRRFAQGGRPPTGETVLVGEEGPELFETDTPGTIYTAQQTKQLLSNNSQPSIVIHNNNEFNITINGNGDNTEADLKKAIKEMVQQMTNDMYSKLIGIYSIGGVT